MSKVFLHKRKDGISKPLMIGGKVAISSRCCCGFKHFTFSYDIIADALTFRNTSGDIFGPYSLTRHVEYYWDAIANNLTPSLHQFSFYGPNQFLTYSPYFGSIDGNHFSDYDANLPSLNDLILTDADMPEGGSQGLVFINWLSQNPIPLGDVGSGNWTFHFGHTYDNYYGPGPSVAGLPVKSFFADSRAPDIPDAGIGSAGSFVMISGNVTFRNVTIAVTL